MLEARRGIEPEYFLAMGGAATLASYGPGLRAAASPKNTSPSSRAASTYFETETHIFVHANYDPDLPMAEQLRETLLWESLRHTIPGPHLSGKTVITGHTAQKDGEILDLGYLKCIDTYCYGGRLADGPRGHDRADLAGQPPGPVAARDQARPVSPA